MSDPRVRGVPPTGQPASKVYDVIGVKPRRVLQVWILGEVIESWVHHFVKDETYPAGRSRVCLAREGHCPWCGKGHDVWLGYVACLEMPAKKRVVLRVGAECARAILKHCGRLVTLRGAHLGITAEHDGEALRAVVESLHQIDLQPLPVAHEIHSTLCTLLGVQRMPDHGPSAEDLEETGREAP